MQFVLNCTNYGVNLLAEEVKELLGGDFGRGLILLLESFLLIDYLCNRSVVVLEIRGRLPIVQIDQHVRQV